MELQAINNLPNANKPHIHPLRLFISGVAGTGKSLLIDSLQAKMMQLAELAGQPTDLPIVVKMATSGLAAEAIGASTIHKALKLPVQQTGIARTYLRSSEARQVC